MMWVIYKYFTELLKQTYRKSKFVGGRERLTIKYENTEIVN